MFDLKSWVKWYENSHRHCCPVKKTRARTGNGMDERLKAGQSTVAKSRIGKGATPKKTGRM